MLFNNRSKLSCLTISLLLSISSMTEAKTYRWVDEQGKTHFSDSIPAEESKYQRDTLNKAGRVVETSEKAKTKEEYEQEQHLQMLRNEQEQLIAKQAADDQVLLSTYRSVEDMHLTLNGRMQALDAQRRVAEGNLARLQKQLELQQKKAAEQERNGQAVPKNLLNDIHSSEQQIQLSINEINAHINKKNQIKAEFETDIERFKFLTQSKATTTQTENTAKTPELEGLFNCVDKAQCDKAWIRAAEFVKRYSSTPINNQTDQLILSLDPKNEKDLSLSVSKMETAKGEQKLFLDIRCHHSRVGAELCASQTAAEIRAAFRPYLETTIQ
jgi:hypothetical protein